MKEYIIPLVDVRRASLITMSVDAIVNPANSFGFMGSELGEMIKKLGGQIIEDEAIECAPIQVGDAALTGAGDLACKKVIHAPITHNPGELTDVNKLADGIEAALSLADAEGMKVIAFPGMYSDGVSKKEAASTLINTIRGKKFTTLEMILIVDLDEEIIELIAKEIKKARK